jgi:hypothetical protein
MKLLQILLRKSYRSGEIIFIFLMLFTCLGLLLKSSILLFPFFILVFKDKFYYLIWDNDDDKVFYLQFQNDSLKKILILKQLIFIIEFNIIFFITSLIIFYYSNIININFKIYFSLNFFILANFIFANYVFNFFQNLTFNKKIYWFFASIFFNFLLIIIIMLLQNKFEILFSTSIIFMLLIFTKFSINYLSKQLFKIK